METLCSEGVTSALTSQNQVPTALHDFQSLDSPNTSAPCRLLKARMRGLLYTALLLDLQYLIPGEAYSNYQSTFKAI
jgi:hypothetical protein